MNKSVLAIALCGALAFSSPNALARGGHFHHGDHVGGAVAAGVLGFLVGQAFAPRTYYYDPAPTVYYAPPREVIIEREYAPRPRVYYYERPRYEPRRYYYWDDDD